MTVHDIHTTNKETLENISNNLSYILYTKFTQNSWHGEMKWLPNNKRKDTL